MSLRTTVSQRIQDFTIVANIGASYSGVTSKELGYAGPIRETGIPNLFNVYDLDNAKKRATQVGWREATESVLLIGIIRVSRISKKTRIRITDRTKRSAYFKIIHTIGQFQHFSDDCRKSYGRIEERSLRRMRQLGSPVVTSCHGEVEHTFPPYFGSHH